MNINTGITNRASCNCVISSTYKGGQIHLVLFSHGPNKAFLVPDSFRATENKL
jgi:hypothetical protein